MSNFVSTSFSYNGISSESMEVMNVSTESGLTQKKIFTKRKTRTDLGINTNNFNLYNFGNDYEVITFSLELAKLNDEAFTENDLYTIGNWLFQNDYCEFISGDNISKTYYAKAIDEVSFYTNGLQDCGNGYITINFECSDPWCFLPEHTDTSSSGSLTISNTMNVPLINIPCKVEFTTNSTTAIITNTEAGISTRFDNLNVSETISMDVSLGEIASSTGLYRYNNFTSKQWLKLIKGTNTITTTGIATISIKYQIPILA